MSEENNNCSGNCEECTEEHNKKLREEFAKPIEDDIFELAEDFGKRMSANGIKFTTGTNPVNMGEIEATKLNQAKVLLGWIKMMIMFNFPLEGEFKSVSDELL